MEFFKPGILIDFMRHRRIYMGASIVAMIASAVSFFYPGPNYGTDFLGGTEIQVGFQGDVDPNEIREALDDMGYEGADVVAVVERPNEFILRTRVFSTTTDAQREQIRTRVREAVEALEDGPAVRDVVAPEGADRVRVLLGGPVDPAVIQTALTEMDISVVRVTAVGAAGSHVYEAQLAGVAEELLQGLTDRFEDRGPRTPDRVERVGPRAGAQLRDAAVKSLLYTLAFIMIYVAFRFDLRYAPGAVFALIHDALVTVGVMVLVQKEFNLSIVAALLTIIGFSINDTIVIYDRIRENMARQRDMSLHDNINLSTSQMLSRTIITSGTALLSVSAFFIWGTAVIRDISFALFIGMIAGVYSSVYVAAPMTEWMDRRFFSKAKARAKRARSKQRAEA